TLGKILGGGMPVGAYGGRGEVMDSISPVGPVYQAGTLSGNPVAMASGIATLEVLRHTDPYDRLEKLTERLAKGLQQAADAAGVSVQVAQIGSMFTVFFHSRPVTNYASASQCDTEQFARYFRGMLDRGIYLPCSQFEANFISAAHTEEDVEKTVQAAREVFAEWAG
ncbi:MAG TPA: aminotransferase class III-fold pyridoxal phosphate-dependent enzyme, partial [Planctomycetaceae bacterium]|nr:aminotransferase class III-fold pyridoxal phosphate-dependent enzyme [Planctomycetaceae bacterium]